MNPSHRHLPRTHEIRPLRDRVLRVSRVPARALLRRWYDIHVHGDDLMPRHGPVLLAPNHVGYLDGPLLAVVAPRPMHTMVKEEMFTGVFKTVLQATAQIPLDRFHVDPHAVKLGLRVLRDGKVLTIFPEGSRGAGDGRYVKRGWAYLAAVTGAPIVPVAVFGSRLPGTSVSDLPPRGQRVDVVYGEPIAVAPKPWPRRSADILSLTEELQKRFREHIERARRMCDGILPGAAPDAEGPEPGSVAFGDAAGAVAGSGGRGGVGPSGAAGAGGDGVSSANASGRAGDGVAFGAAGVTEVGESR